MTQDTIFGTAEAGVGGYLAYKGLEHGLPRALGIRTEYHTTSKENASLIKKAGNWLDPKFGGKNGWAAKIESDVYVQNSKNYVHITGIHKDCWHLPDKIKKLPFIREAYRRMQLIMYKTVGNLKNPKEIFDGSKKEIFWRLTKNVLFGNKTKVFYIPGIDSYFNTEFISDIDDVALKSDKKLKCYNNRFSAMFAGLKKFGLKGIKENKGRVAAGIALIATTGYLATKLIKNGLNKITGKNKETSVETNTPTDVSETKIENNNTKKT